MASIFDRIAKSSPDASSLHVPQVITLKPVKRTKKSKRNEEGR